MITLPPLQYPYDTLEPYIDETTMRIHHTKHHQTYIDKLNIVLEKYEPIKNTPIEELLRSLKTFEMDEKDRTALRNNGGGHVNHTFFWSIMGPKKKIDMMLVERIDKTYGSVDNFKKQFTELAVNHFGSGWVWLAETGKNDLTMYTTLNQDSPYLAGHTPKIALDIWEHAYYLKYQNRRAQYVANWWNVLKLL
jgi:Fe-Mn family superoxide dismutase